MKARLAAVSALRGGQVTGEALLRAREALLRAREARLEAGRFTSARAFLRRPDAATLSFAAPADPAP